LKKGPELHVEARISPRPDVQQHSNAPALKTFAKASTTETLILYYILSPSISVDTSLNNRHGDFSAVKTEFLLLAPLILLSFNRIYFRLYAEVWR